jgi:ribosome-binding protein aMBF1 (putative translation factor)
MTLMKISANLKEYLEREGVSIHDLSRKVSIPVSTLHGWINGAAPKSLSEVKKVAMFLNLTMDELCFNEKPNDHKNTNIKIIIGDEEFEIVLKRS